MMKMSNSFVDTTNVICPITYIKAKMALEKLEKGQILEVKLREGEPIQNVPRRLAEDGQRIHQVIKNDDDTFSLFVEKVVSIGE